MKATEEFFSELEEKIRSRSHSTSHQVVVEDNNSPSDKNELTNPDFWDIDKLLYKEPRKITPVIDPVKGRLKKSRLYFSERRQRFDMPFIEQRPNENPDYEFICVSSDYILNAFCEVVQARMLNGFRFTCEQIIAEWNYFAFTLRMLRSDLDSFKRLGKPCKEEVSVVEKYVNFYDGDYKDNEKMKVEYLEPDKIKIEDEIEEQKATNENLRYQLIQTEQKFADLKKYLEEIEEEDDIEKTTGKICAADLIVFFDGLNALLNNPGQQLKIVPVSAEKPYKEKWSSLIAQILNTKPKSVGNKFSKLVGDDPDEESRKKVGKRVVKMIKATLPELSNKIVEIYDLDD